MCTKDTAYWQNIYEFCHNFVAGVINFLVAGNSISNYVQVEASFKHFQHYRILENLTMQKKFQFYIYNRWQL